MFITKVFSYNGAWGKLLAEHEVEFHEIENIFKDNDDIFLFKEKKVIQEDQELQKRLSNYIQTPSKFKKVFELNGWSDSLLNNSKGSPLYNYLLEKNNLIVDFAFGVGDSHSLLEYIFRRLITNQELLMLENKLPIRICLNEEIHENIISIGVQNSWESYIKEFNIILPIPIEVPFIIFGMSFEPDNIEIIEKENLNQPIIIERSIEFKPEHYQAGLGILSYFGTVMRKKYPDQNAKVRIEQDDDRVRLIVESANGDKEIIERAFDEFGLVIHQDIKPEEFYDNYLDVAELKTKLGTFESELKFQHQLVEMKEHRIIELQKDKEFLENIIEKALVRPNSPVYINNHLNNTQTTNINYQRELNESYDDLDKLIDIIDNDSLKKRLERALTALDTAQNLDGPEEVKNSGGMKQLAKILNEANEAGSEINSLAEKGGQAVELIKNLGRKYNSVAEWCGLPVIPSVLVKE